MANEKEPNGNNDFDYFVAKYLMCEYPSRLDLNITKKITKRVLSKKGEEFLDKRVRSIIVTTFMYIALIIIMIFQLAVIFTFDASNVPVIILKAIGLLLLLCSFPMWWKQTWKEEEFYGWALANFSKDEPLYLILQQYGQPWQKIKKWFHKKQNENDEKKEANEISDKIIIAGDWLKNRPSIIFLLIVSTGCLYFFDILSKIPIPYAQSFLISITENPLKFFIQLAFGSIFFLLSFPYITDRKYKEISGGKQVFWGNPVLLFLWLLSVVFPTVITCFVKPETKALIFILVFAGFVYAILFIWSFFKKRSNNKKDDTTISGLNPSGNNSLSFDTLQESFKKLSCRGQMRVLSMIQSDTIKVDHLGSIDQLIHDAKNPKIAATILDIQACLVWHMPSDDK